MEQTFNNGRPPAGESGVCVTAEPFEGSRYLQFWHGDKFGVSLFADEFVSGRGGIRMLLQENEGYQPSSGAMVRWVTIAELEAIGIPEAEARTMVHRSQLPEAKEPALWYPPQQEGFGPWIECDGATTQPIADHVQCQVLCVWERDSRAYGEYTNTAEGWGWLDRDHDSRFVAYCVKLEAAQPDRAEPTADEVEATQKPDTPESYVADLKADEAAVAAAVEAQNKAMQDRDKIKKAIAPAAKDEGWREYDPKYPPIQPYPIDLKVTGVAPNQRHYYRRKDEQAGGYDLCILKCAPWTNRLGGWGAQ